MLFALPPLKDKNLWIKSSTAAAFFSKKYKQSSGVSHLIYREGSK
jgi:hypothetical protein